MLLRAAKHLIKSSLYRTGIEIRKKVGEEFFDLTLADSLHPIEAVYTSCGKPCLVKVPLDRMVTFDYTAFSLDPKGGHPFIKTLEKYENNRGMTAEASPLRRYYELYQPRTARELMDIESPSYPEFNTLPALSATPLWSWKSPEAYCAHLKAVYRSEDEAQGVTPGRFIGGSQFGPIEPSKLAMEYRRLTGLYESINKHGFRHDKCEWITGTVWADDDDWVIAVSTGQHRLACLAVLGYDSAIVYLQPSKAPGGIMLRSCSRYFPSVVNGLHTEAEALIIFDRIMSKTPPIAANAWLAYCKQEWTQGSEAQSRPGARSWGTAPFSATYHDPA